MVKATLAVLLVLALGAIGFLLASGPWLHSLLDLDADTDGVVQSVQSLSRLETTRYTIETVVTADEQGFIDTPLGRIQIGRDRLLMIIHGSVIAGIDLERLVAQDIETSADGKELTVRLPAVEIFSVDLDNTKTRVYSRETWLKRANPDLESEARQGGEAKILAAACEDGIMRRATEDAQRAVERFVAALDLPIESVSIVPAPAPRCPASAP